MRCPSSWLPAAALVAGVACGDVAPVTSPGLAASPASPAPTPSAFVTPEPAPPPDVARCQAAPSPIPAWATHRETARAELDGDRLPDTIRVYGGDDVYDDLRFDVVFGTGRATAPRPLHHGIAVHDGSPTIEAAVDMDGDGRDELVVHGDGNTNRYRYVLRLTGCDLSPLRGDDGEPLGITFGIGGLWAYHGAGFSCRDTDGDGRRDMIAIEYAPVLVEGGVERDPGFQELEPARVEGRLRWRWHRRHYAIRGQRMTVVRAETGLTRDPSRPALRLVEGWDCGIRDQ